MTITLDGYTVAKNITDQLKKTVSDLKANKQPAPCLAVVIVGEDPASQTYVASKIKRCEDVGFASKVVALPDHTTTDELSAAVLELNHDNSVDGILVQLPLPPQIDTHTIINLLDPSKDVDGLHPENVGLLEIGTPRFIPCTPKGIITLLDWYDIDLSGKTALVIGRSRLVGNPIATLLTAKNATVTVAHSKTKNLLDWVAKSEVVVVAMGKPAFIKAENFNANHILVDVGIHRIDGKITGDVEKAAYEHVAYATPVPRGVGPMTIVSLLENTLVAYALQRRQS